MRIARLDLLRYGHFTDRLLEFPRGEVDLHVVFGPNEAGKSTSLAAIGDLLFGIPKNSPFNFLHANKDMRIAATLEQNGDILSFARRKGNKDTLLGDDGLAWPAGETALAAFLLGTDRAFFERMFSLDHGRLEEGGRAILEAKDDEVGQVMFSAGSGISGLRRIQQTLDQEADGLWGPRKAEKREFYRVRERLEEAERALREHTLSAKRWEDLQKAREAAEEACETIDAEQRAAMAERNRLSRIRRVHGHVRRKAAIETAIAAESETVRLPADAAADLERAIRDIGEAATRIETLAAQRDEAAGALESLAFDEKLVRRADDVRRLDERRIEIGQERRDLPKREAELTATAIDVVKLAGELGWKEGDAATIADRLPPRPRISTVRHLMNGHGALAADVAGRTRALEEAEAKQARLRERMVSCGEAADVSRLASAISAVRDQGDLAGRLREAGQAHAAADAEVERLRAGLRPEVADARAAVTLTVPSRDAIQEHRDRTTAWETRLREEQQRLATIEDEVDRIERDIERLARREDVVAAGDVASARAHREAVWALVRALHVEKREPSEAERAAAGDLSGDPLAAFDEARTAADRLADRRFDNAEAAAALAALVGSAERQQEEMAWSRRRLEALATEGDELARAWAACWRDSGLEPRGHSEMLDWLVRRERLGQALARRDETMAQRDAAAQAASAAKDLLVAELAGLADVAAIGGSDGIGMVLRRAMDALEAHRAVATDKVRLTEAMRDVTAEIERLQRDLASARDDLAEWQRQWAVALDHLGLPADTAPAELGTRIEIIEQIRGKAEAMRNLRHDRIDKIRADIADFERDVAELVAGIAGDLVGKPADAAMLELTGRLDAAEKQRERQASKRDQLAELDERIAALGEEMRAAEQRLDRLKALAGVESRDELADAIARSDRLRAQDDALAEIVATLEREGDGMDPAALAAECADVDIDDVIAREASLEQESDDLKRRLQQATEARFAARTAFEAIGGGDAAARAAADREAAIADLRDVAERYVRVRSSAVLLKWATDRYMREQTSPLLNNAGRLFGIVTGGSFASLRVDYDDRDNAQLSGVREDGSVVPISGMSTGTADQLYLALRIAAISDYLSRTQALPFIADDLFINFDDARAVAGFRMLHELASDTQVLFFTHHRHLVDIARATLGAKVNVVTL
ncbi:YhaN family protein [Oceanibacterium hippocampi]|uniref:YhaN AAA domain-containing protein n=1 Tax=Oceanibacterium hippocampi TaxID=745714 RepID=A0A1Y5TWV7_9PROT|nr:YhaN family protein [Oceanibacterium hippocampi]SLN75704.1 hypothetical protein OCH7691_03928 [Oceanibacterium hippocampi]